MKEEGNPMAASLNQESNLSPGKIIKACECHTLPRAGRRCGAVTFRKQRHPLQGQQGLTCFLCNPNIQSLQQKTKTAPQTQRKCAVLRCHLPLLPGQKPFHLLLGKILGVGEISRVKCCHPRVGKCLFTGHPPPGKTGAMVLQVVKTRQNQDAVLQLYVYENHLVSLLSKELMKFLASSVISSKLSSSNSHCAAVTKARVSASLLPWNGDSPLNLKKKTDSVVIILTVSTYIQQVALEASKTQQQEVAPSPFKQFICLLQGGVQVLSNCIGKSSLTMEQIQWMCWTQGIV